MMRGFKAFLVLGVFALIVRSAFAGSFFSEIGGNLERVGMAEIVRMSKVDFESGNYRLDPDFTLGYGDTVVINFWGKVNANYTLEINRDGNIVIPFLGKVSIMGFTLDEARLAVKKEIDKKYTNVEFDFNLTDIQDIRVTVLGNVKNPGSYAVSPFCKFAEAIAKSGGPNNNGSLIDIRLIREGRRIARFNVYDFISKGLEDKNIRLKHGDTIYIPKVKNLLAVKGDVRYRGVYEVEDDAILSKAIDLAGGMLPTEFKRKIYILRVNPEKQAVEKFKEITLPSNDFDEKAAKNDIVFKNGDTIIVTTALDFMPSSVNLFKTVRVSGEVNMPGSYLIKQGETLGSLMRRVGGFENTAFIQGVVFTRESVKKKEKSVLEELIRKQKKIILEEEARLSKALLTEEEKKMYHKALEDRTEALNVMASRVPEGRIIIDLKEIMEGKSDIYLEEGDSIYVPPIPDWVLVTGAVYEPRAVAYKKGESWNYYVDYAGGPGDSADKDDIYIIKANGRIKSKNTGYGKISHGDVIIVPEKKE